jgi:trehalose 6-phosphate synthase
MRIVIVSNRVSTPAAGQPLAGGMTVGVQGALKQDGGLWLGWSGLTRCDDTMVSYHEYKTQILYVTVDLPAGDFAGYYNGFSNQVLWPLLHDRPDLVRFLRSDYDAYRRVSERFADEVVRLLREDDVIWVQDYHLIPLGHALRRRGVRNRIGFFLHTPFSDPREVDQLPVAGDLRQCFAAYDLAGFQTEDDLLAFEEFQDLHRPTGAKSRLRPEARAGTAVFPVGIDTREFEDTAEHAVIDHAGLASIMNPMPPDVASIIAVDRLDYSKGIVERFCAFESFLRLYPEWECKASLVQIAPIGRGEIPAYREEATRVRSAHAAVNAAHGSGREHCAHLLTEAVDRRSLAAAYRRSRVGLVTPLRDGMNLVAKEYVAAQDPIDPGVLVLSRSAGAAKELAGGALVVDPRDPCGVAHALNLALTMDRAERLDRWKTMIAVIRKNDAAAWASSFIDRLTQEHVDPVPLIARPRSTDGSPSFAGYEAVGTRIRAVTDKVGYPIRVLAVPS